MAAGTDVRRILEIRRQRKQRRAEQKPVVRDASKGEPAELAELADKCIAIGISTGGPPALASLFAALRPPVPPIVVVQHMPPSFTKPLAWRLDSLSALSIKEAARGDPLKPGQVLIAQGGKHLQVRGVAGSATDPEWSELEKSALTETGNILGCAYVNALSRLVGTDLAPSAPYFIQDYGVSVLQQALMAQAMVSDSLLLCEIRFHREGEELDWQVIFVPMQEMQDALQRSLHAAR